jgi:hypothetical protein
VERLIAIKYWWLFLLFLVFSLIVYASSFDNPFREDDFSFLKQAGEFSGLGDLYRPNSDFSFYRPGALGLFLLEVKMFGPEGGRFLEFNFGVHVLNALLLIQVLLALGFTRAVSFLAGSLFVVGFGHYGKQVMWARTSGPLFAVLLSLSAVLLAARSTHVVRSTNARAFDQKGIVYLSSLLLILLVVPLFHESGIVAPVLVGAIVWMKMPSNTGWRNAYQLVFLSPIIVWLVVYLLVPSDYEPYGHTSHMLLSAPGTLCDHLGFMLFPIKQSRLVDERAQLFGWLLRASGVVRWLLSGAVLLMSAVILLRRDRALKYSTMWMYVTLLPFCFVRLPEGWLELRYVYFAAMPLCGFVAFGLIWIYARPSKALKFAAMVAVVGMTGLTSLLVSTLESQYDRQSWSPVNANRTEELRQRIGND